MQNLMRYGKNGYELNLPEDWDVSLIEKRNMPVLSDPKHAMARALHHPIGTLPLAETIKGCKTTCILICDITRPVPNHIVLPALVRELLDNGMSAEGITVLVATGLHRPNEGQELLELVGSDWVLNTVRVENHFACNDDDHVYLGQTETGIDIKLDKRFVEADLRIVTGLVEPHFMAGYSGGRKVIAPGIAHQDTITRFHTAEFLEHPNSANCIMDGNPLHETQIEIIRKLGNIFAVNTVIDDGRRLSYVNFGEIEKSHLEAVAFMKKYAEIQMTTKYKTIVTSGGGYPLDKNYYQTIKGMVGAMDILEPGGNLIILSECSEGIGSPEYVKAQQQLKQLGADKFMESLQGKRHAEVDEWETEMQLKAMRIGSIHLFSEGLSESEHALTGVRRAVSPEDDIMSFVNVSGDNRVAVIPEGPYVIPMYNR